MKRIITSAFLAFSTISFAQIANDTLVIQELNEFTILTNKQNKITGAGNIIDEKKIDLLNQTNINNVLRSVPGVFVRDEEGNGLRPNIGLRGTAVNRSNKITLMEDGILTSPAPYSDPSAYYFPSFARMNSIEILKGSSQIKYGPYTIGGALNLISTPIPQSFKAFGLLSYGSFNTNQQRIYIGDNHKNFDYLFEVNRLASTGFKELDNGGNTGFDRRDIMGKVRWHSDIDARTQQSLMLKFVNTTEDSNETYLGLTYNDYQKNPNRRYAATQKDYFDLSHQNISLTHTIVPINGLIINTSAYYNTTFRDWARANTFGGESINKILNNPNEVNDAYNIMTGVADGNVGFQSAARTFYAKGIQLNANYRFVTNEIAHNIQFGSRMHYDKADRYGTKLEYLMQNGNMILANAGLKGNQENQVRRANSFANYLTYELNYHNVTITPGVRFENIDLEIQNFGNNDIARSGKDLKSAKNSLSVVLPGIGFNYQLNNDMRIFGGVHKGFSPPGMPTINETNNQAKEEKSVNYELGYDFQRDNITFQICGFMNDYANILGSDNISGGGAGSGDTFNAGNAVVKGLEMNFGYDFSITQNEQNFVKIPIEINYTYTSAKFNETFINGGGDWGSGQINNGEQIPFITPHLFSASVGLSTNKFNINIFGRYVGDTRVKPGIDALIFPSTDNGLGKITGIKGYFIADVSANYMINNHFTLFTLLNNVTNSDAIVANLPQGYRPNMPFAATLGLKYRL